jgi:hypothetical protein
MEGVHFVLCQQVNLPKDDVFVEVMPGSVQQNAPDGIFRPIMDCGRPNEILKKRKRQAEMECHW